MASPDLHWLCDLFESSLGRYTDRDSVSLTKEEERDLLISLSQISRRIRCAADESPSGCRQVIAAEPICGHSGAWSFKLHPSTCHGCLNTIIAAVAASLIFESQFVRHSSGKIFLALSNFLLKHESIWKEFIHLLCLSLQAAVLNVFTSPSALSAARPNEMLKDQCITEASISFFRLRLVNAKWFTVVELLQILRIIFKHLNHSECVKIYMNVVNASLSVATSNILSGVETGKTGEVYSSSSGEAVIYANAEQRDVVLGIMLQLLCSLVRKCGPEEASEEERLIASQIIYLVPKIFSWGLLKCRSSNLDCISQFLKHKIMVLMIRLGDYIHQEHTTLVLWLRLLWNCFEDVLSHPLCKTSFGYYSCLEGSPFLATMADGNMLHSLCNLHLQRQAIFLLLKCSFNLINLNKETCVDTEHREGSEQGILELTKWLQRHMSADIFVNQEFYLEECRRFALSFLKLFLDEDDYLFEMLLLLLDYSRLLQPLNCKDHKKFCEEVKGDALFHFASIFNPIHLFHLFLAGIQYDHSTLLDCLISKDTGVLCVRYLLRCLRIVACSWDLFVEFVMPEFEISLPSCKKRKICLDPNDSYRKAGSSTSSKTYYVKRPETNNKMITQILGQHAFENARKCLLSLKRSVENLHKKNLFPYNPTALLRSFTRFEELCKTQLKEVAGEE